MTSPRDKDFKFIQLPGHGERWAGAKTLSDTIFLMALENQLNTPEFKSLVVVFGEEKVWGLLGEKVYCMVQERKTKTPLFQRLMRNVGVEHLRKLYDNEKKLREKKHLDQKEKDTQDEGKSDDPSKDDSR